MKIVQVAVPIPLPKLFDYLLADDQPAVIGSRVRVAFRQRKMIGMVINISDTSQHRADKLKMVEEVLDMDAVFSPALWKILQWAAAYYHVALGEVLHQALPPILRQGKPIAMPPIWQWVTTDEGSMLPLARLEKAPKQQQALTLLRQQSISRSEVSTLNLSEGVLKALQKKGLCTLHQSQPPVVPWQDRFLVTRSKLTLNPQQAAAVAAIKNDLSCYNAWLVAGITGSGKTEVYLSVIEQVLAAGCQALVLVPEIGLTPQTIARFRARFAAPIDVVHSGLTHQQRFAVWLRARRGESAVIIGTRSAIFIPLVKPGIIIIDEEHDSAYKQQEGWRYHARDLAVLRARQEDIPIVMGSATPSLETLQNVHNGRYRQLVLTHRAGSAKPALQQVVDLKGVPLVGNVALTLITSMRQHLSRHHQVLLFLNRRGYAPALICHCCGWVAECVHCERPYTLHQQRQQLRCHHCDSQRQVIKRCPKCHSSELLPVGIGTEQLELQLKHHFPQIPISRIDRDTTQRKGALEHHLQDINQGGARILIGTQMLAKGHHFPAVTLVVILEVDSALFSNDFRATERFAQLYTQISGRAGRAFDQGEVLLQTHYPHHPLLQNLMQYGYFSLAEQLLEQRRHAELPPFAYHALIRADDSDNQRVYQFLRALQEHLANVAAADAGFWFTTPTPAVPAKRKGRWRWQLLLQHRSRQRLQQTLTELMPVINTLPAANRVAWLLDVDPTDP